MTLQLHRHPPLRTSPELRPASTARRVCNYRRYLMASIRITSIPPGEAPAEIRQAWVGLTLPLMYERPRRFLVSGVLSGTRGRTIAIFIHLITLRLKVQTGYVVPSLAAIEILERSDAVAGRWWRENADHSLRPRNRFLFAPECCEAVEPGATSQDR